MSKNFFYLLTVGALFFYACDSTRIYEEFQDLPEGWAITDTVEFQVALADERKEEVTVTTQFRCNLEYPFSNLYYRLIIMDTKDSIVYNELHQTFFFDKKTGKPYGEGLGDLFSIEEKVLTQMILPESDSVSIQLVQYMRLDTLLGIDRVGLRINSSSVD